MYIQIDFSLKVLLALPTCSIDYKFHSFTRNGDLNALELF